MLCINIIDNICKQTEIPIGISESLAIQICDLIKINIRYENQELSYSGEDIQHLLRNKNPALISSRLSSGLLVFLTDKSDHLVGCGMVENKKTHYEAKTLHISREFRGKGFARLICDIRENVLREHGITMIFTESLKFPNTISFHTSRGFRPFEDGKIRKYSILMRKDL